MSGAGPQTIEAQTIEAQTIEAQTIEAQTIAGCPIDVGQRPTGPRPNVSRVRLGWFAACLVLGVGALGAVGCEDSPVGPSLSNVPVSNLSLRSTTGNPGLCCCHVTGTARNDNSVPVHVTIKFEAHNRPDSDPLSTILYFIKDLQPGASHNIDAPGFIFPCTTLPSGIGNVRHSVEVKGIAYPPF
jgi:hypothetical protein